MDTIDRIREIIGKENAMSGNAEIDAGYSKIVTGVSESLAGSNDPDWEARVSSS